MYCFTGTYQIKKKRHSNIQVKMKKAINLKKKDMNPNDGNVVNASNLTNK